MALLSKKIKKKKIINMNSNPKIFPKINRRKMEENNIRESFSEMINSNTLNLNDLTK